MRLGRVAADEQDRVGVAGCPPAGTAARGRARTRGCRPPRRRPCRSGRCSRCCAFPGRRGRTCPACRPSRWSARRRRTRRPHPPRPPPAPPDAARDAVQRLVPARRPQRAALAVAQQRRQSAGPALNSSAAVQPLRHSPPRLVGKSRAATTTRPGRPCRPPASWRIAGRNRGNASRQRLLRCGRRRPPRPRSSATASSREDADQRDHRQRREHQQARLVEPVNSFE